MRDPGRDILALLAAGARAGGGFRHVRGPIRVAAEAAEFVWSGGGAKGATW
jgi:hypothetical protein